MPRCVLSKQDVWGYISRTKFSRYLLEISVSFGKVVRPCKRALAVESCFAC
jgi:hypothetical protein